MKTYFENYTANGGDTTMAKLEALKTHSVRNEHLADVASKLSGSGSWDKISEIPQPTVVRTRRSPTVRKKILGNQFAEMRLPRGDWDPT
ncbi:MAG: hypothetical protein ACYCZW_00015 [Minisyncoccota bacterium]